MHDYEIFDPLGYHPTKRVGVEPKGMNEPLTLEELHAIVDPILELVVRKNADYGGSMFELGLKGIFVRMTDKVARLKRLVWEGADAQVKDESVSDVFRDLIGYAAGALVYSARKGGA